MSSHNNEKYASRFGAIMSMAGMAVGMGNVWRFPYMVGQYGGGAFVFAYLVAAVCIVAPLAIVEAGIGKGLGKGMVGTFTYGLKSSKLGKLFGIVFAGGYATMNFFYFLILAASVYFVYSSATSEWNTVQADLIYGQIMENQHLMAVIIAALVLVMIYVTARGVSSGIEAMSKYMMPLMVLFFIIAIVFAIVTVDDIAVGYNWYLKPDWAMLKNPALWVAAIGQACFSIGIGPGCILIYGSHLDRTDDVSQNILTVAVLDTCAGILAGLAIIPACIGMGLTPQSGSGLIFMVLPTLLSQIPGGAVVGILVFGAIFFAGFSSAIAQFEVIVSTFVSDFKWTRKKSAVTFGLMTLVGAVVAAYSTGWFDFWNNFAGNYVFIVTAGIGAIVYVYIINAEKVRTRYVNPSSDIRLGRWFAKYVKFVAAPVMILMMLNSLFPFLMSFDETFSNTGAAANLETSTIVMIAVIIIGLYGSGGMLLKKCMDAKKKTVEEIETYERETLGEVVNDHIA